MLLFTLLIASKMVWIPGGSFMMGSEDPWAKNDEKPPHLVEVSGFWIDETPVTNREFAEFVEATGYVTTAERTPTVEEIAAELPKGAELPTQEELQAGSLVFRQPTHPVFFSIYNWWEWTPGASWRHPQGPGSTLEGLEEHPVVHVSWVDAAAFAKWANKRLPTEAEWERAARGGRERAIYVWGNEEFNEAAPQCNIWQGVFPHAPTKRVGTTPVKQFPPNAFGLYDMAGNVWQWCSDYYDENYYALSEKNPQGPLKSSEPGEPHVHRGGSYLCHASYCKGYRVAARMRTSRLTSLGHLGFRCAK